MPTIGTNTTPAFFQTNLTANGSIYADASGVFNNVSPSATTGIPLISTGSATPPTHGTMTVPGGGTGISSITAYAQIAGGTTSTGAFQDLTAGSSGKWIVSAGNAAVGTFKTLTVKAQVFTSSGTYTPTSGMAWCILECVGGGGGGGASSDTIAAQVSAGGGGGGGGYAMIVANAATVGASQTVTIGAAGSAGTVTGGVGGDGGSGGTSSVGSIVSALGGGPGIGGGAGGVSFPAGGAGGSGSGGTLNLNGQDGETGVAVYNVRTFGISGRGGNTKIGPTTKPGVVVGGNFAGTAGGNYGTGGDGAATGQSLGGASGGAGAKGIVVITEYIIS